MSGSVHDTRNRYLRLFPGTDQARTFPSPLEQDTPESVDASVAWKLRYAPNAMSREDQMYAASILSAYAYLILDMSAKDRQAVVMEIRKQVNR